MLACHECRRFVREESTACPFCGATLVAVRAPLGGFLGVLLGVSLVACGGDDGDSASGTLTAADDSATSGDDTTIGNDSSSASEVSGPLYGPVTFDTSGDDTSGGSESDGTGGESDSSGTGSDTGTGTDTGDATTGGSESAGPLYGPATSN